MPTGVEEAWLALIGAIMGTSGLKVVEHVLSRGETKELMQKTLREELKTEIRNLKEEIDKSEEDVDHWKARYYELVQTHIETSALLLQATAQLKQAGKTLEVDTRALDLIKTGATEPTKDL